MLILIRLSVDWNDLSSSRIGRYHIQQAIEKALAD